MSSKLTTFIVVILVVLVTTTTAFAQGSVSRKFDEFVGEADYEDLIARLDNFAVALKNEPATRGQIIVYRTRHDRPDVANRALRRAKDYLVRVNHIDAARLETVDGGMTGCLSFELWIVPPGASPPERHFTYKYPLRRYAAARKRR